MKNSSFIYNGQTFKEGSKVRVIVSTSKEEQDGEITEITHASDGITRFYVLFNNGGHGASPGGGKKKGWHKSWLCTMKDNKKYSGDFPKLLKLAIPENIIEVDALFIN